MIKRILPASVILMLALFLTGCNEKHNPLLGQWQEVTNSTEKTDSIIEFTPSTMRIKDQAVTVVYQIRQDKVRVSASKKAIIYELINADEIRYEDEKRGTVTLVRVIGQ